MWSSVAADPLNEWARRRRRCIREFRHERIVAIAADVKDALPGERQIIADARLSPSYCPPRREFGCSLDSRIALAVRAAEALTPSASSLCPTSPASQSRQLPSPTPRRRELAATLRNGRVRTRIRAPRPPRMTADRSFLDLAEPAQSAGDATRIHLALPHPPAALSYTNICSYHDRSTKFPVRQR